MTPKDKIILALDVPTQQQAQKLIDETCDYIGYYKIGLGFLSLDGINFAQKLVKQGHKIFLDLKLFDIGQTITDAVHRLADTGVHIMTVHGDPYVVSAAVKGRVLSGRTDLDIYAVTVLTSLDADDVKSAGYTLNPHELVMERAKNAAHAGADGVIASGHECRAIKSHSYGLRVITPGIRSAATLTHDQKRIMTPLQAIESGADHLVIGREITQSAVPADTAKSILDIISQAHI
jgi:orotidine-5'-phosphate decarboxylase